MDDFSQKAIKLVIEYCLEVLEQVEETIRGKASLARLEAALDVQYAEKYENKVYQYRWALRHLVVKEATQRPWITASPFAKHEPFCDQCNKGVQRSLFAVHLSPFFTFHFSNAQ